MKRDRLSDSTQKKKKKKKKKEKKVRWKNYWIQKKKG